jgi:hypothetical protein
MPRSYSWARLVFDGALVGEVVVGDPQDVFERVRSKIQDGRLRIDLGYPEQRLEIVTPPLRGGSRYLIDGTDGYVRLTYGGKLWTATDGGVCSLVLSRVQGPGIPFFHPPHVQVFEVDAGLVCTRLRSPQTTGELHVPEALVHFYFAYETTVSADSLPVGPYSTSTETTPRTG